MTDDQQLISIHVLPYYIGKIDFSYWFPDAETGFLTCNDEDFARNSGSGYRWSIWGGVKPEGMFNLARKLEFLEHLKECWPDYSSACHKVGISRRTYSNHAKADIAFRQAVLDIAECRVDGVESVSFKSAMNLQGVLDRREILRAFRPELYNRAQQIEIRGQFMTTEDARRRADGIGRVVDAQLVRAVTERKQLPRHGGSGSGSAGGAEGGAKP